MKKKGIKTIHKLLIGYCIFSCITCYYAGWIPILGPLVSYVLMQPYVATHYPNEQVGWPRYNLVDGSYNQQLRGYPYSDGWIRMSLKSGEIYEDTIRNKVAEELTPLHKSIKESLTANFQDEVEHVYVTTYSSYLWYNPSQLIYWGYLDITAHSEIYDQLTPAQIEKELERFAKALGVLYGDTIRPNTYTIIYRKNSAEQITIYRHVYSDSELFPEGPG